MITVLLRHCSTNNALRTFAIFSCVVYGNVVKLSLFKVIFFLVVLVNFFSVFIIC